MATPYVTIVRNVVPSTQDLATAEWERNDCPVLVIAQRQTSGRGRSGNDWWQAPRAVAASLALGEETIDRIGTLPLATGLAVRSALARVCSLEAQLKWPNDLEVGGRKIGGILVERAEHRVVVGCGITLYWPDPPGDAGALFDTDPGAEVGVDISKAWADALISSGGTWDRDAYAAVCSTIGSAVTWASDGQGDAVGVDDGGGLLVETAAGRVTLRSGEARTVRRVSGDA